MRLMDLCMFCWVNVNGAMCYDTRLVSGGINHRMYVRVGFRRRDKLATIGALLGLFGWTEKGVV